MIIDALGRNTLEIMSPLLNNLFCLFTSWIRVNELEQGWSGGPRFVQKWVRLLFFFYFLNSISSSWSAWGHCGSQKAPSIISTFPVTALALYSDTLCIKPKCSCGNKTLSLWVKGFFEQVPFHLGLTVCDSLPFPHPQFKDKCPKFNLKTRHLFVPQSTWSV